MSEQTEDSLTELEKSLLVLAANGYTRSEIAQKIHKSVGTIDKQMHAILRKLGASNIVHAVSIALREKII